MGGCRDRQVYKTRNPRGYPRIVREDPRVAPRCTFSSAARCLQRSAKVLNPRLLHFAISLGLLISLAGCSKHDDDGGSTPGTPPSPPPPNAAVVYTAIGASDAMGVGGSVPVPPVHRLPERHRLCAPRGEAARIGRPRRDVEELRHPGRRPEPVDSGRGQSGGSRDRRPISWCRRRRLSRPTRPS